MKGMSDDDLITQIESLERQAIGYFSSEVANEQATAMDYYLSKPFGTEEDGKSAIVSSDVWDVVEGLTPMVLKPFVASADVVRFNPHGPDDEEAADQESDYINWVVTQKNDSFNQLIAWVKTGLLQKNGVAKYWWEKSRRAKIERYAGIPDDLYALILQDEDAEVIEHTEFPDETTGEPLHDVTVREVEEIGEAKYAAVPPEEFLIGRDATSPNPQGARFVEHCTKKTISELREMGYDVEDDISDLSGDDTNFSEQYLARRNGDETTYQAEQHDPALREVQFREVFLVTDYDGDGIAELRKVCLVGKTILANEETEEIPFCAWTPYTQPFKFYGKCPADETTEIQLVKSTLWRQSMNNIYSINNNRTYVSGRVNLDDLIDNQIGGYVRIDSDEGIQNDIKEAGITPIGQVVQPMIEYLDQAKENRTGFTRYNQGSDSSSLNKTATGIRIITENANARVDIIARAFAEQGLAPLMRGIHGLCRRHATKDETVKLRGKWVTIDPRGWKTRQDLTVSVGLGTSDQQMRMAGAQMLLEKQMAFAQLGLPIVTPDNFYESSAELVKVLGYKSPERFFTSPKDAPPTPPPNPMESPEAQFKAKELEQKDREISIKEREVVGKLAIEAHQARMNEFATVVNAKEKHHAAQFSMAQHAQSRQDAQASAEQEDAREDAREEALLTELQAGQQATMEALQKLAGAVQQMQEATAAALGKKVAAIERIRDEKGALIGARRHLANGETEDIQIQ